MSAASAMVAVRDDEDRNEEEADRLTRMAEPATGPSPAPAPAMVKIRAAKAVWMARKHKLMIHLSLLAGIGYSLALDGAKTADVLFLVLGVIVEIIP